ncbi:D-alanyl-D-alanine carboxypeptidase/D-alanyl-D-alanine-endopeptidase [Pleomorphovibrio marinus]|uniref:D-alanyl-D-alanine carboxypeptidase/D-alanyl-D-alanine-endopeptidase n=1 Tax=Pleomorphovibrio marinus TaxID=2164132 RepID=UPI000E09EED7|nr:D-alanyl-D-alanine carboxypeptidase [Pleomorphovibrio marinus]
MKHTLSLLLTAFLGLSCTTQKISKTISESQVFNRGGFTGFMLYDPEESSTIHAINEDRYFVPASNTKLFTFYTAQKVLGERVNALNYHIMGDSLLFWGTGDPSFLHPDFGDRSTLDFLEMHSDKRLFLVDNFDQVTPNGPGWSWSWFNYYFGAERSAFPLYGNVVRFSFDTLSQRSMISPAYFKHSLLPQTGYSSTARRDFRKNLFQVSLPLPASSFQSYDKPIITSPQLALALLKDTLKREVEFMDYAYIKDIKPQKWLGMPRDSLFRQMMTDSDNFLAEQLMLLVSDQLFDSLNMEGAISHAKKEWLAELPDEPEWEDGSGLSSYNKFTPRSVVRLLDMIWEETPEEKILAFFPSGGKSGTIRSWYAAEDGGPPFVYAKTGTLSNSHCLSGYVFTSSGKRLIFSFMHNNYTLPSDELKKEMERVLKEIYRRF